MAPSEQLELYDSGTCPYAQRAWIALVEKQLPFKHNIVDLSNKPEHFTKLYAEINPDPDARAKVPILIDTDGTRVIESNIVAEYLEDKYPDSGTRLLPSNAAERARVKLFIDVFSSKIGPVLFALLRADSDDAMASARAQLKSVLQVLDDFLTLHGSVEGGDYFLGGRYSMAEVATAPFVQRAVVVLPELRGVDVMGAVREGKLLRLERWMQACLERPSSRLTGEEEAMINSMRKFMTPMNAA